MSVGYDLPFPTPPLMETLTSVVVPFIVSRRKASYVPFVSHGTRSEAELSKITYRPSGVIAIGDESPLPTPPLIETFTDVVVPFTVSRMKASSA